jgi:hypothetical protein
MKWPGSIEKVALQRFSVAADLFILRAAVLEWAEPLVWVEIWVLVSASESLLV